jgi:guanylate kinase
MSEEPFVSELAPLPHDAGGGDEERIDGQIPDNLDAHSGAVLDDMLAGLLARQEPAPEFAEFVQRRQPPLLVVLTGPSGVGKDVTLERMKQMGVPFHYVVTVTTRKQRPGEVHGKHYYFVSKDKYRQLLEEGQLIEHAEIYGNMYGIPRSEVADPLRRGMDVIMKPDVQGARRIRELEPDAVFIYLAPPSMEEQARRLFYRKTEDPQELAVRLGVARQEMHELTQFEYFVVNHNNRLDDTVRQIEAIMAAEKSKVHPRRIRMSE